VRIDWLRIQHWKCFIDTGDLPLGKITTLVGRNNSGKSALLQAIGYLQTSRTQRQVRELIRAGEREAKLQFKFCDLDRRVAPWLQENSSVEGVYDCELSYDTNNFVSKFSPAGQGVNHINQAQFADTEPNNLLYKYFSKRKVLNFDETVNLERTNLVTDDLTNLVSKVARLINAEHPRNGEFRSACERVLGFHVGLFASFNGQQIGVPTGSFTHLPLDQMGEGVSSLLGLITQLCVAENKIFLIEELENDLHPQALKAILDLIIDKSETNQFIVSTHSNIVVRALGSAPSNKLYKIQAHYQPGIPPKSSVDQVSNEPSVRFELLRELGYELYDSGLWEGWLILEESSIERLINDYFVRWFAPRLSRVKTVAANGTGNVKRMFEDFRKLFLFAHLAPAYNKRAWVIVDGDESGLEVIQKLRTTYNAWPERNFISLSRRDFELYLPARFADTAIAALALHGDSKRIAKQALLDDVCKWCDENDDQARSEFAESAHEIVDLLRRIETEIDSSS
jgi:predicted ATPase